MKGQFSRTLMIIFYSILAILVAFIVYQISVSKDGGREDIERVNCDNACAGELVTGQENIQGCNCEDFKSATCLEDEYLCGGECVHIGNRCSIEDDFCKTGEFMCSGGCTTPVHTVCPPEHFQTECGCVPSDRL